MLKGLLFEIFSSLMVFNLYPFGVRQERDPKLLSHHSPHRPVLLIHGIFHNRSAFFGIRRRLKKWGWGQIYTMDLSTARKDIATLAQDVSKRVDQILEENGASKCDLIAHSLGGLVAHSFIQLYGGHRKVKHCITLGTPHLGTWLAYLGIGKSVRDLIPGSRLIKQLQSKPLPAAVHFTSFWSPYDSLVIPAKNGRLKINPHNKATVQNIKVTQAGHAGLLFSQNVAYKIASLLDAPQKYHPILEPSFRWILSPMSR